MKKTHLILLVLSLICLIIGYVWKSEKIFRMEIDGTNYTFPYQFIFLSAAIILAFTFLMMSIVRMFKK
ncbi:hypothetical protein [Neptunitalea chrysea]|uniref:hypothetical protein n=1 Tax=Neptunitalea chrysea TaxID=1647581 RepID=UPI002491C698|nr:hypothetical protein [Neptunitalea chrysea]